MTLSRRRFMHWRRALPRSKTLSRIACGNPLPRPVRVIVGLRGGTTEVLARMIVSGSQNASASLSSSRNASGGAQ